MAYPRRCPRAHWYHRDDGPAIEWANGSKAWFRDGDCHRDDGPAIEEAGGRIWCRGNVVLRREDER